ncbi:MAG: hypothetical protein E7078_08385 [Bacteroidales bacterium]|nr:hypothetical protein [Bacteroidales bacterium]
MEEWKEYNLGDLVELKNGVAFKSSEFIESGIPVIKIKNVKPNKILLDDLSYVSEQSSHNRKCFDILPSDILITMTGNRKDGGPDSWVGKVALFGKSGRYLLNQRVSAIRIKRKDIVEFHYLAYLLSCWDAQLYFVNHSNSSGGQANISPDVVYGYNVSLPSLCEQTRLASILKSLDDKIEVNRRINDNLEQQAQALFRSWFVDFEPFKGQQFVESEFGEIPQSLLTAYVSEIPHTLETGRRPKGGVGELTSGVPSVGAEHVKGMGNYDYSKTKYITADYASSLKTGKINGYELLIYKDGGKPGYFIPNYSIFGEGYPYDECYLNEHVFKLDFGDRGYNAFCYFFFKTDFVMNYLNAQGGKAAIPGINRQDIENILIYSPQNESVKEFGWLVLPMIKQILINCKESRRLANLRDTLLPRLMSGELKVNEIENVI